MVRRARAPGIFNRIQIQVQGVGTTSQQQDSSELSRSGSLTPALASCADARCDATMAASRWIIQGFIGKRLTSSCTGLLTLFRSFSGLPAGPMISKPGTLNNSLKQNAFCVAVLCWCSCGASIHCATEFVASQLHSHSEWLLQRSHYVCVCMYVCTGASK